MSPLVPGQIAFVTVKLNLYLPVFLQLGKLQASSDWSASAGIFTSNKGTKGLAYYTAACTMAGCLALASSRACNASSW